MGNAYLGSKATAGLCQAIIALMPVHSVYIESHLGGGAIMKRKPPAQRNIGIDVDAAAIEQFRCDYAVELVHGCCHNYLLEFEFDGSELIYADPPYLRTMREAPGRYRYRYEQPYPVLVETLVFESLLPPKRLERRIVDFLERDECAALAAAPDIATRFGRRDRAMLLQTSVRVSELIGLTVADADLQIKERGDGSNPSA